MDMEIQKKYKYLSFEDHLYLHDFDHVDNREQQEASLGSWLPNINCYLMILSWVRLVDVCMQNSFSFFA